MTSYATVYHAAYVTLREADEVWWLELCLAFPKDPASARYHSRGRGEPGSNLRLAWEARDKAREAWEASRNLPGNVNHRVKA